MGIIGKLLGFTGLPQWVLELFLLGLLVAGVSFWWHRHNAAEVQIGVQKQQQADNEASAELFSQAAALTKMEHDRAVEAETARNEALQTLKTYLATHPTLNTSQLCHTNTHGSGQSVSTAGPAHPRDEATGPTSGVVQPVSGSDNGFTGDRSELLRALGAYADEIAATLTEYQQRAGVGK